GQRSEAIRRLKEAAGFYAQLAEECPDESLYRAAIAEAQRGLCEQFFANGERNRAEASGRVAIKVYERMLEIEPDRPDVRNQLAWVLTTCPVESLRDPRRAVVLARRATEKAPNMP